MDELDHRCQFVVVGAAIPQSTCRKKDERRAQALTAALNDVFGDLANEHDVRMQSFANDLINGQHVRPDQVVERLQLHSLLAPAKKPDNGRSRQHRPSSDKHVTTPRHASRQTERARRTTLKTEQTL